jgi:DNA-binding beta-propeller fold protein YncE
LKLSISRFLLLLAIPARLCCDGASIIQSPSSLVYPDFWHTPMGLHRGTPKLLDLLLGGRTYFNDPEGLACTRMKENGPENPQLTVFGVNTGNDQVIYNPDMLSLDLFGSTGNGDGQFAKPIGVAALPDGRVAVADTGNNRVALLRYQNKKLVWQQALGTKGSAAGQFLGPTWVAYDSQGRLYVSDTGNNRIQVFADTGAYLFSFGSDPTANNSLVEPQAIAVVDPLEPHSAKSTGAIFVVDQYHGRIQKFDLSGQFLAATSAAEIDRYLVYFSGIALDYFNNLWVADRGNHQLLKFDQYLELVDGWGKKGQGDYCFNAPRGLAIYRHYGQVFVAEENAAQYLWVGADIKEAKVARAVTPDGKPLMRVDFRLTENCNAVAWIEDESGKKLADLFTTRHLSQGAQTAYWDGIMLGGGKIQAGAYFLVFQAEAGYSSATYFKKEMRKKFWVK